MLDIFLYNVLGYFDSGVWIRDSSRGYPKYFGSKLCTCIANGVGFCPCTEGASEPDCCSSDMPISCNLACAGSKFCQKNDGYGIFDNNN